MKRILIGVLAASFVGACSGSGNNPFDSGGGTTVTPDAEIPAEIQNDLGSFTFDPVTQTLTVTGLTLEGDPLTATYTRNPALDQGGYLAYTTQQSPLDRHATSFVRQINGTSAAVAVTGGQFGFYFGGSIYGREGPYTPATGLATYAGNYVGLTNLGNSGGDLLPLPPGSPVAGTLAQPGQAAATNGFVLINADFTDNQINGSIFNRTLVEGAIAIDDLELSPSDINADGTFSGNVTQGTQNRGQYAGNFGGNGATEVAGSLFTSEHISNPGITDEEEYGIFVLIQCGQPGADPACD